MKLALVIQPATIASGGGQILNVIGQVISDNNSIDLIYLKPSGSLLTASSLIYIKKWTKILRSSLINGGDVKIMSVKDICKYDRIFAGWVGDVGQLLEAGVEPGRICHICQSVETWANETHNACITYSTEIERWFVADWLVDSLANITSRSFNIGNAISDIFFEVKSDESVSTRDFVTYLTHPGWWKGVTESALVSENISKQLGLQIQTFGTFKTGREHVNFLKPTASSVLRLLDRTRIYVGMSLYEGMPLIAIEALARGCKLVLSDIPAHREIYQYVGKEYCKLISTPPLNFAQINSLNWDDFMESTPMVPAHVYKFKMSAYRDRIKEAFDVSMTNI